MQLLPSHSFACICLGVLLLVSPLCVSVPSLDFVLLVFFYCVLRPAFIYVPSSSSFSYVCVCFRFLLFVFVSVLYTSIYLELIFVCFFTPYVILSPKIQFFLPAWLCLCGSLSLSLFCTPPSVLVLLCHVFASASCPRLKFCSFSSPSARACLYQCLAYKSVSPYVLFLTWGLSVFILLFWYVLVFFFS